MKVLHLNAAYGTIMRGALTDGLKFHRYLIRNKRTKIKFVELFLDLIKREKPDIIFFTEIKMNDILLDRLKMAYPHFHFSSKYGDSWASKLPMSKNNVNGFFSTIKPDLVDQIHLKIGEKKLVLHTQIQGFDFFLTHLTPAKRVRTKQFLDLCFFINNFKIKKHMIILGDFNTYYGLKEFPKCLSDFKISIRKKTFPSKHPLFILDNFLLSKDIRYRTKVLDDVISDHLPIVLNLFKKNGK